MGRLERPKVKESCSRARLRQRTCSRCRVSFPSDQYWGQGERPAKPFPFCRWIDVLEHPVGWPVGGGWRRGRSPTSEASYSKSVVSTEVGWCSGMSRKECRDYRCRSRPSPIPRRGSVFCSGICEEVPVERSMNSSGADQGEGALALPKGRAADGGRRRAPLTARLKFDGGRDEAGRNPDRGGRRFPKSSRSGRRQCRDNRRSVAHPDSQLGESVTVAWCDRWMFTKSLPGPVGSDSEAATRLRQSPSRRGPVQQKILLQHCCRLKGTFAVWL